MTLTLGWFNKKGRHVYLLKDLAVGGESLGSERLDDVVQGE